MWNSSAGRFKHRAMNYSGHPTSFSDQRRAPATLRGYYKICGAFRKVRSTLQKRITPDIHIALGANSWHFFRVIIRYCGSPNGPFKHRKMNYPGHPHSHGVRLGRIVFADVIIYAELPGGSVVNIPKKELTRISA